MTQAATIAGFERVFLRQPALVTRSPGRVNLIGEHTDYNDGWVMPVAIQLATWTAIAPRADRTLRVVAGNRNEEVEIDLDLDLDLERPGKRAQRHWSDYVRGIAFELQKDGHALRGADLWFAGDVPEGAGLSSSAALEMSIGMALLVTAGLAVDKVKLALAGQRAEHNFAGTRCGVMDQFVSALGRAGHALMLDCRSLEYRLLPLPEDLCLVICDSGVQHELAEGEYNRRRTECEQGVAWLRRWWPAIQSLRDVTPAQMGIVIHDLPPLLARRCRHVVDESRRVEAFASALEFRDLPALGRLMSESHVSLRDDYEVSCPELNALVELACLAPGVVGARMTGGGFGGCTINLVQAASVGPFREAVSAGFRRIHGRTPRILISPASGGASIVFPPVTALEAGVPAARAASDAS